MLHSLTAVKLQYCECHCLFRLQQIKSHQIYYSAEGKGEFRFRPGPVFNNLVLADEINRAPAKVQAALLEAMEERTVTVAGKTHQLPKLFLVMATMQFKKTVFAEYL